MPIRPEIRRFYNARWRKLRLALLEAAGHRCQYCGRPHRLLNVAHLSHDPADRRFLAVLCPRCHSRNDTPQRIAMTRERFSPTWAQVTRLLTKSFPCVKPPSRCR